MKYLTPFLFAFLLACQPSKPETAKASNAKYDPRIEPVLITDKLPHDTDDPALWIDPTEVSKSTVLGMDKEKNGGVYAFDLEGKIIHHKTISPVERPNNIDVEYGIVLGKDTIDIAVFTESFTEKLRVISMPDMSYVDGGGTHVFVGETRPEARIPMGIGLYKDTASAKVYAMVSRRSGPTDGTYLWQYELVVQDSTLTGELVRKFGAYSGSGGIEAVAVDDELGYVYYSDETSGIRKYYAHPDSSDRELAHFGTEDFLEER
ncbi:MAG: phytase, partial [Saprospiraceae bacterium]|nr:phytase [Saprospiraceae bacterium]